MNTTINQASAVAEPDDGLRDAAETALKALDEEAAAYYPDTIAHVDQAREKLRAALQSKACASVGVKPVAALMAALTTYREASAALLVAQVKAHGTKDGERSLTLPVPSQYQDEFFAAFDAFKALEAAHDAALASPAPSVGEPVPLPGALVIAALRAMDTEARKRGAMFPQTADEQAEDIAAVRRVIASLEFYTSERQSRNGWPGVKGWPSLPPPAAPAVTEGVSALVLHPNTADLVNRFAQALAEKLAAAELKYGYSDGWCSPDWMGECRVKLLEHVAKGDPRDVAAYCAFLWHHNASTAIPSGAPASLPDDHDVLEYCDTHPGSTFASAVLALAAPAAAVPESPADPLRVACVTLDGSTLTVPVAQLGDVLHGEDDQHTYTLTLKTMTRAEFDALGEFNGF